MAFLQVLQKCLGATPSRCLGTRAPGFLSSGLFVVWPARIWPPGPNFADKLEVIRPPRISPRGGRGALQLRFFAGPMEGAFTAHKQIKSNLAREESGFFVIGLPRTAGGPPFCLGQKKRPEEGKAQPRYK